MAGQTGIIGMATAAWVHRLHQLKTCMIADMRLGAHPFAAFGDGFIGQADNIESVLFGCQMHLHFNRFGFDALKGNGLDIGDHVFSFLATSLRKNAHHHKQGLICVARQA